MTKEDIQEARQRPSCRKCGTCGKGMTRSRGMTGVYPLTTTISEFTLPRTSSMENETQYGQRVVGPSSQCPTWWPRRGSRRLAGMGLTLDLGRVSRRGRRRRVSHLEGTHDWTGLGLGDPLAWRRKSCVAHRHDGSGPVGHDRADRRTNGDDSFSRSDRTRLIGLLDHVFIWLLQASRSVFSRSINRRGRQPYVSTIRTLP